MRRIVLASLLAMGLALSGGAASAEPPESRGEGPACADITRLGYRYVRPSETKPGTFSPRLEVAAPACRGVTYTFYVLDADGNVIASEEVRGDRSTTVGFEDVVIENKDAPICFYATSSAGRHVFDREPDEGCIEPNRFDMVDYSWFP